LSQVDLGAVWELVGWDTLSAAERAVAKDAAVLGGGSVMALYALFGFYPTGRRWPKRRGRKRKGRRR
jgi:hypothetical protein